MSASASSTARFDPEEFARQRLRFGATWGRPVRFLQQTTSTNDLALAAIASEAKTGIVWLADEQTQGRGRRGSSWLGRPGESLLMSVLLRWPTARPKEGLTLASGLAVRTTCQELAPSSRFLLKWPNDVLAAGKKVSGILVESRAGADSSSGVVIGIGINLLAERFDQPWGHPTSLKLEGAAAIDLSLEAVLARLLRHLESEVSLLITRGLGSVCERARQQDALSGRRLELTQEGQVLVGLGQGLTDEGHLRILTDAGLVVCESGHVRLLEDQVRSLEDTAG